MNKKLEKGAGRWAMSAEFVGVLVATALAFIPAAHAIENADPACETSVSGDESAAKAAGVVRVESGSKGKVGKGEKADQADKGE